MNEQTKLLWAKSDPHHPLWCHLLDTAAVARALIPRFGPIEGLPDKWIPFLVGCHDIGKADRWFQNKDEKLAAQLNERGLHLPVWHAEQPEHLRKFRHEARSREWLQRALVEQHGWKKRSGENVVAKAVVGHHGDWAPELYSERDYGDTPFWEILRDELGAMLWETLAPSPCALESFPHASSAGAKLAAYVILSDWIASNDALFCYPNLPDNQTPARYYEAACTRAQAVVAQMKLDVPAAQIEVRRPTFGEVWPERQDNPRPLQEQLELRRENLAPGLAIIEAPMGEGKTEAAIYLAQLWMSDCAARGIYFALPTQATANAMHARYDKFLAHWNPDRRARLMHGGAWLRDETPDELEVLPELQAVDQESARKQARSARDWFRPTRRALLSLEGVGTVDQALLCALRVKFGPLRLLGLSQKTLVVDEVHAYDEFMGVLLERLLQWCRALEINVILLSATLSQAQKMALCRAYGGENDLSELETDNAKESPYPLLSFVPRESSAFSFAVAADAGRTRDLAIEIRDGFLNDFAATAHLAAQTIQCGGCACVLANTVGAAQQIFGALKELEAAGKLPADCDLSLFHARFRAEKRAQIEAETIAKFGPDAGKDGNSPRPRCAILVATQVVEQSLDVDFDFFLSQLAPVDLLLQRAGRMWRHQREWRPTGAPTLTILTPPNGKWEFGATGKIYAPEILLRSLALCHEKKEDANELMWNLPADFRPLIERCYDAGEALGEFAARPGFADKLEEAVAARKIEIADARSEANIHCWIEPKAKTFEPVVRGVQEADEESGEHPKFFIVQTRRGDQSVGVLVLWRPLHFDLAARDASNAELPRQQQRNPPRRELVEIFGQKVGAPRWWFKNVTPLEGFAEISDGKSFLKGHKLLPLQWTEGEWQWRGRDSGGAEFAIVDDPQLGLVRRALQNAPTPQEEADGGFNTP